LFLSRAAVVEVIAQAPEFQENGQFSAAKYSAYLASRNTTDQRNVAELQTQLPIARLASAVADTAIAPRSVASRLLKAESQQREVGRPVRPQRRSLGKVSIDEAQAKAHYDANAGQCKLRERVRAEYVMLSAEALAGQEPASEAEIKAAYEQRAAQFRVAENRR